MLTTFIVNDVRLYRDGLASCLAARPGITVLGSRACGEHAMRELTRMQPATAILGASCIEHRSLILRFIHHLPETKLVIVGASENEADVVACALMGVSGIVSSEASLDELVLALECAIRGEFCCSPRAAAVLARRVNGESDFETAADTMLTLLTERQREVAVLIEQGFSNKQIARQLNIEVATVKNHVHKILEKMKVTSRAKIAMRLRAPELHDLSL